MRAGQLRHRIEIQGPTETETEDGMGGFEETWAKIENGDDWAKVWSLTGQEKIEAMQLDQRVSAEVTIRYRPDIDETMRIVLSGQVYQIESLVNVGLRNRELKMLVKEVV